jgi:hypothetical protein
MSAPTISTNALYDFIDQYQLAFNSFHVKNLIPHFAFPLQVIHKEACHVYADSSKLEAVLQGGMQFYKKNNSLRYCNGSYYTFVSKDWTSKYHEWLDSDDYAQKSFELYYGNGVVD